ncbi:MAG: hypothetical protein RLZZ293_584, partial [Pseudomonadota bacterium]
MHIKRFSLWLCSLGLIATNLQAANLVKKSSVVIDNISVGKMDGDSQASQFSMILNFHNDGDEIEHWQLGFYMPRTFYNLAQQKINPDLDMQICTVEDGSCVNLKYVKAPSGSNDLGQGYFNMLEPVANFSLKPNHHYYIQLAHNNQWNVGNISALPQSLFLIADDYNKNGVPRIYPLPTELNQYSLTNYNHEQILQQIEQHLQQNWQNSQPNNLDPQLPQIVPQPISIVNNNSGDFTIPSTIILHNQLNEDNQVASYWSKIIQQDWQLAKLPKVDNDGNASTGIIINEIGQPRLIDNNPEGYRLTISATNITIEALTQTGVYYALQTLRQIWSQNKNATLPALTITDYPRLKYRGVMLDSARHFFSVNEIKSLIDVMASQKLNTLHWHLSDDEAFRIELPLYPNIANLGAKRGLGQIIGPNMLIQNNLDTTNLSQAQYPLANSNYQGSYSPEQIQQLITYANANQITIIPEIDLPGHARSLIKALPDIMIDENDKSQFVSVQGYTDDVIPVCTYATNISTGQQFTPTINAIINNIAQLFNQQTTIYALSNEISIGGDEVSANAWTNDSSCRNEWSNLSALEKSHLFFQKLAESNSQLIFSGWQQFIQNDNDSLGKNIVKSNQTGHVWVWNPSKEGIAQAVNLANHNYPTVLAYADRSYFDLAYSPSM